MPPALTPVPRNDGKNMAGYRRLWAAPAVDVATIPAASGMDVASAITMVSTKVFSEVLFDPEAGAWRSNETPEAEGSTGKNETLQFFVAGNTAAIRAAIETFDGVYCIWIGEQQNGVLEIIGEVGRGLRVRCNYDNGRGAGNRVGYMCSGKMDFDHEPYTYSDGTIAE